MRHIFFLTSLTLLSMFFLLQGGCADKKLKPQNNDSTLNLYVSVPPGAYLIERIGGEHVNVNTILRGGENPASYEPSARQMVALESSDAYFYMGLPFEKSFLKKLNATLPELPKINLQEGIKLRSIAGAEACSHTEGSHAGHSHAHNEEDPHLWLSPLIADAQAKIILSELSKLRPTRADYFAQNYAELSKELTALDKELKTALAPLAGRAIFVHHPAFGYLTDAYGLEQIAVEFEGKEPSPKRIDKFIQEAKEHKVSVIFVQPQFATIGAQVIAEAIGGRVVKIDPLAYDLIESIRKIALEIVAANN